MKNPWSISTTVRNPERILPFLRVLKEMEREEFDEIGQRKFQTLLIQNRLYQPMGLSEELLSFYETDKDKMSFQEADAIFEHMKSRSKELQKSEGFRGRTSAAPLSKMGLVIAKKTHGAVEITELGNAFLDETIDIGDVYFRFLIKWQLPNPDTTDFKIENGYDIKPFVGVLHLINLVNKKSLNLGKKAKGLSKQEFSLFCPSLINFQDIENYADKILGLREAQEGKSKKDKVSIFEKYKKSFARDFLETFEEKDVNKFLNNLKDYGDNAIRYFRSTRFLYIRGNGFYIDLEPRRQVEIQNLLNFDNASSKKFSSKSDYLRYIADISEPKLPWESKNEYLKIIAKISEDIKSYEKKVNFSEKEISGYEHLGESDLKKYIEELRVYRRKLQDTENHQKSQEIDSINTYIETLDRLSRIDRSLEDRPILLEKFSSLGLNALNDAIQIKPNYPVGDDNEPTFTAPANTPDIECYYENFNTVCEVTMLNGRDQWYNEGQPVMRHLRDFENKNNDKKSYCLFIAPKIHRDTLNTFWASIKYEYEGEKQYIVPFTINNFTQILKILVKIKEEGKFLTHSEISRLYDEIISASGDFSDSTEWLNEIPKKIKSWEKSITF